MEGEHPLDGVAAEAVGHLGNGAGDGRVFVAGLEEAKSGLCAVVGR